MHPAKNKLVYLAPAREDFIDIARHHLELSGPNSARSITENMEKAILRLADFSLLGQVHPDPILAQNGYRKLIVRSPYVCIYKVIGQTVYVYRIVDGRTDYPRLLR